MKRAMHENSLAAFREEGSRLTSRALAVLGWVEQFGPATDREVMRGMGFSDPNAVRPRLTELVQAGKLMEVCTRKDEKTGKTVRVVDIRRARQSSLFQ